MIDFTGQVAVIPEVGGDSAASATMNGRWPTPWPRTSIT